MHFKFKDNNYLDFLNEDFRSIKLVFTIIVSSDDEPANNPITISSAKQINRNTKIPVTVERTRFIKLIFLI